MTSGLVILLGLGADGQVHFLLLRALHVKRQPPMLVADAHVLRVGAERQAYGA